MLGALSIGLASVFALGPSGFNLYRIRIWKNRFPLFEMMGLLMAEFVYLLIAIILLLALRSQIGHLNTMIHLISGLFLIGFSIQGLINIGGKVNLNSETVFEGFQSSFLLTLGNPMILLLHIGVLTSIHDFSSLILLSSVSLYFLGFILPTIWILQNLPSASVQNQKIYKFFEISIYLSILVYAAFLVRSSL